MSEITVGQFLLVCAFVFALFAVVVLAIVGSIKPIQPSVTNEEGWAREIKAVAPQHNGSAALSSVNTHSYEYDDLNDSTPESISEYLIQRKKTASRG